MTPGADGRVYACAYCQTKTQVAVGAEQLAAGLALDLANTDAFLAKLAQTLTQGLGERTTVEGKADKPKSIEIDLAPDVFLAKRDGKKVLAQHKKVVRGVALKTETLPLDRWVTLLTEALARHTNENARASWVLAEITGRR